MNNRISVRPGYSTKLLPTVAALGDPAYELKAYASVGRFALANPPETAKVAFIAGFPVF